MVYPQPESAPVALSLDNQVAHIARWCGLLAIFVTWCGMNYNIQLSHMSSVFPQIVDNFDTHTHKITPGRGPGVSRNRIVCGYLGW